MILSEKIRADVYLVQNGYCKSREQAKAFIMSGNVFIGQTRIDKSGEMIDSKSEVIIKGEKQKYVSRGGQKLEKAIESFNISLKDNICMDIGASTGGFTDCMLQLLAAKVYSVDVGYGQLAWSIRNNPKVVVMERTNIRYVKLDDVELLDFASIDVSFISLKLVLPVLYDLLKEEGKAVCLVKPQFEAGKGKVGKNGVVREISIHLEVLKSIYDFLSCNGFRLKAATFSPVKGPQGNIEYLYFIEKSNGEHEISFREVTNMIEVSHKDLD